MPPQVNEDDEKVLHPNYVLANIEDHTITKPYWNQPEIIYMDVVNEPLLRVSRRWIEEYKAVLKRK